MVRRRLRERRITCHRPYGGLVLTLHHRHQRQIWACNQRGQHWQNMVFSDESCFNLWNADGRIHVYRRRHEHYVDNCVVENNPNGGGGVMVWVAINYRFKTQLVVCQGNLTARRNIDQVLRPVVVLMFHQHQNLVYQHDNARPHVLHVPPWTFYRRTTLAFCLGRRVPRIATRLNMYRITLDVGYIDVNPSQQASSKLTAALHQEWGRIPRYPLRNLCGSMRSRLAAVVASRGGHTRY